MILGNVYTVTFQSLALTAAGDFFAHTVASGRLVRLLEVKITQSTDFGDAEAEQLSFLIERVLGSPTAGSGGSTFTPIPHDGRQVDPDDAPGTWRISDTTQNSGGTRQVIDVSNENVQAGYTYLPLLELTPVFKAGQAIVVSLSAAPTDSVTFDGVLRFQDLPVDGLRQV